MLSCHHGPKKTPFVDLTSLIHPFTRRICRAAVKTACPRLHRASNPAVITPSRCVGCPSVSLPPWHLVVNKYNGFLLFHPNLQVHPPNVQFFTVFTKDYNPFFNVTPYICKLTRIWFVECLLAISKHSIVEHSHSASITVNLSVCHSVNASIPPRSSWKEEPASIRVCQHWRPSL